MCYEMVPIASHDEWHAISQCEHGTIHLTWGRAVVSFHPDELLLIAYTLHHYKPDERCPLSTPYVALLWNDQGIAQLWLQRVGLYLTRDWLRILLALIAQASQRVMASEPRLLAQHDLVRETRYHPNATPPN